MFVCKSRNRFKINIKYLNIVLAHKVKENAVNSHKSNVSILNVMSNVNTKTKDIHNCTNTSNETKQKPQKPNEHEKNHAFLCYCSEMIERD